MSNVIERAEMLVDDFPKSLLRSCEFCDRAADLLPGLVAECKRQQERAAAYSTELAAAGEIAAIRERKLEAEAARWQALRPEVQIFAEAMERKLRENDHKGGWDDMPSRWLRGRLAGEVRELEAAIAAYIDKIDICNREQDLSKSRQAILSECADIANFAMMIADNCKSLVAAAALGQPRAWLIDDERIEALEAAFAYKIDPKHFKTIEAMLAEAER